MKQEKSWDFCKPIPSSVFCELGKLSVSTEKHWQALAIPLLLNGFLQGLLKSCRESLNKSIKANGEENVGVEGRFLLDFCGTIFIFCFLVFETIQLQRTKQ